MWGMESARDLGAVRIHLVLTYWSISTIKCPYIGTNWLQWHFCHSPTMSKYPIYPAARRCGLHYWWMNFIGKEPQLRLFQKINFPSKVHFFREECINLVLFMHSSGKKCTFPRKMVSWNSLVHRLIHSLTRGGKVIRRHDGIWFWRSHPGKEPRRQARGRKGRRGGRASWIIYHLPCHPAGVRNRVSQQDWDQTS